MPVKSNFEAGETFPSPSILAMCGSNAFRPQIYSHAQRSGAPDLGWFYTYDQNLVKETTANCLKCVQGVFGAVYHEWL